MQQQYANIFGSYMSGLDAARRKNALAEDAPVMQGASPQNALAQGYAPPELGYSGGDWLVYDNHNATRNKPLSPELSSALSFLPELGVTARVISGGQDAKGEGDRRTGSTRHDHGNAADVDFYMGDTKLDWNNPDHMPLLTEIVRRSKAAGITGIGAGDDYMGAGRFHVGFGAPAVWGAGGSSSNAPNWLRDAYYG